MEGGKERESERSSERANCCQILTSGRSSCRLRPSAVSPGLSLTWLTAQGWAPKSSCLHCSQEEVVDSVGPWQVSPKRPVSGLGGSAVCPFMASEFSVAQATSGTRTTHPWHPALVWKQSQCLWSKWWLSVHLWSERLR